MWGLKAYIAQVHQPMGFHSDKRIIFNQLDWANSFFTQLLVLLELEDLVFQTVFLLSAVSLEIAALLSMSSVYIYEAGRYVTHMQIANEVEVKFKSKIWVPMAYGLFPHLKILFCTGTD